MLHLLLVTIVPLCGIAFWWQLHQALDGNSLSWAYTIEWPCFAVLAVVGWWQLVHEDAGAREQRARRAAAALTVGAPSEAPAVEIARSEAGEDLDPAELAERIAAAAQREYEAHLDRLSGDGLAPWRSAPDSP